MSVRRGGREGPAGNQCLCDSFYYALADVNYNIIGLVNSNGALVERYEYTPYGRRFFPSKFSAPRHRPPHGPYAHQRPNGRQV